MIEVKGISKSFSGIKAVDNLDAVIQEGAVFGLIGTNGAGKSTFLRMVCGVLKPDEGTILVDGKPIFETPESKQKMFYISDEQYFFANANPIDMKRYYERVYPEFDGERFLELLKRFGLQGGRKINTFSKGMKKQLSVILGICANTKYLLCDETFDGLDPVMRQAVKGIFIKEIEERGMTPIVASHNLRELEDICDHVGLLHRGGILLSRDLEDMKLNIHKLQCVWKNPEDIEAIKQQVEVVKVEQRGSLMTITIKGSVDRIEKAVEEKEPLFYELLHCWVTGIFIS